MSLFRLLLVSLFLLLAGGGRFVYAQGYHSGEPPVFLSYEVVARHPHRTDVFSQGLAIQDGFLYESGGLYRQSSLRKYTLKRLRAGGRVRELTADVSVDAPLAVFAEGLAVVGNYVVQLTWRAGRALIHDRDTLRLVREWSYEGEGWGLTHDGRHFIMSDGSAKLIWRDSRTFAPVRSVTVRLNDRPVQNLNELEWIEGYIWANIWHKDWIAVIDPRDGRVAAVLNLSSLVAEKAYNYGAEEVLNGIAWDADSGHIWVTGKNWDTLYELAVNLEPLNR